MFPPLSTELFVNHKITVVLCQERTCSTEYQVECQIVLRFSSVGGCESVRLTEGVRGQRVPCRAKLSFIGKFPA